MRLDKQAFQRRCCNTSLLNILHAHFWSCSRQELRFRKGISTKKKETYSKICWLVGCLTSQQHTTVSQRRICSDKFTCCHTEKELTYQIFYLTQSQYTDTGPSSPSADTNTRGVWQGSPWSVKFKITCMTRPGKSLRSKRESNLVSGALETDTLTTWPTRRSCAEEEREGGGRGGGGGKKLYVLKGPM